MKNRNCNYHHFLISKTISILVFYRKNEKNVIKKEKTKQKSALSFTFDDEEDDEEDDIESNSQFH